MDTNDLGFLGVTIDDHGNKVVTYGKTRFIGDPSGGRAEVNIIVDGVPTWREARWETTVVSQLCSKRGIEEETAPVLRPILRDGERLQETADGRMYILTHGQAL